MTWQVIGTLKYLHWLLKWATVFVPSKLALYPRDTSQCNHLLSHTYKFSPPEQTSATVSTQWRCEAEEAESESPRSVVPQMKKKVERLVLHTQVLRIRDKDSHLEEELIVGSDIL
ncbi:hypothetical protein GQ457_06G041930 [Hibiscus cannabinus]